MLCAEQFPVFSRNLEWILQIDSVCNKKKHKSFTGISMYIHLFFVDQITFLLAVWLLLNTSLVIPLKSNVQVVIGGIPICQNICFYWSYKKVYWDGSLYSHCKRGHTVSKSTWHRPVIPNIDKSYVVLHLSFIFKSLKTF